MAKVRDNLVTEGLSGKLGKRLVFRKGRKGKTIVATRPVIDEKEEREFSEAQEAQHEAFRQAIEYAQVAKDQPLYVALAKETDAAAYNIAVADWFGQPEILEIDAKAWTGEIGQAVHIKAKDETKVVSVRVIIHNNGTILEQGEAVLSGPSGLMWTYITTTQVAAAPGILLDANAFDLAGNCGALSVSMN